MDTARVLAMDAVQKVGNGHPGTAMSLAPAAYLLFQKVMRHDPADPRWIARDRFVLSCGHSSITLYTQLYLGGFGLELEDLQALRTWGSKTPGHPELHHTAGVEVTTGPLGQGVANAVGMAMAARRVHGLLDPDAAPGESLFDHHVYALCSDGDLQEGVSGEASSIAGTQELGNLTVIYDRNRISIEGDTDIAFTEDVAKRYEAYGWHVQVVDWTNGGKEYVEDVPALYEAITAAGKVTDKPSLHRARHDHRVARAQRPGHREGPRQRARRRRGRGHQGGARLGPRADLRGPRRRHRAHPQRCSERGAAWGAEWDEQYDAWASRQPRQGDAAAPAQGAHAARGARGRAADLRGQRQGRRDPRRLERRDQRGRAADARAVGRLGRPRRLQQHDDQVGAVVPARRAAASRSGRPTPTRAGCSTSASASTAWARS